MTVPDGMNLAGRALVAAYFLWAALYNLGNWDFNLGEFRRIGLPGGRLLLPMSSALLIVASGLFVYAATVAIGALLLGAFVVAADALFHRFWRYTDPAERMVHKQFLFEHVALIGGLLGLVSAHV